MNMKLRLGAYSLAFLMLLNVCLFGILCKAGGFYGGNSNLPVAADAQSDNLPPIAALTFDDGPSDKYTEKLLDGLKKRGVKATFFLIGKSLDGNEDLVKRMSDEGHLIGNHTYNHIALAKNTVALDCEEIEQTNQKIYDITGKRPVYMRPPFGARNMELECMIDMELILWDVDPLDWQNQNKNAIVRHVLKNVKDNDIILLHDIFEESVDATLEIVDQMQKDGWQFVTVDDLMPEGKTAID